MGKKIIYSGSNEKMDSIGIPINPHSAKLGDKKLTKDPRFIVMIFVLAIWIIVIIAYLVATYLKK